MGPVLRRPRIYPQKIERLPRLPRGMGAQFVPAFCRLADAERDVPLTINGWRGDTFEALRAH
jgi:hypothetical protein